MLRRIESAALAVAVVLAPTVVPAPAAAALPGEGGRTVTSVGGELRCLITPNDVPRGAGSMAVCQKADGTPLGGAPIAAGLNGTTLDVLVFRDNGSLYWDKGGISPQDEITLGPGQTTHLYGWTVEDQGQRALLTNDYYGRRIRVNLVEAQQI